MPYDYHTWFTKVEPQEDVVMPEFESGRLLRRIDGCPTDRLVHARHQMRPGGGFELLRSGDERMGEGNPVKKSVLMAAALPATPVSFGTPEGSRGSFGQGWIYGYGIDVVEQWLRCPPTPLAACLIGYPLPRCLVHSSQVYRINRLRRSLGGLLLK
ncbi:hypothetical protein G7046_g9366 [Stylonectria norvegica]|nr:hypothetical protein G7046_g9366 [Stylonectria norvegica]